MSLENDDSIIHLFDTMTTLSSCVFYGIRWAGQLSVIVRKARKVLVSDCSDRDGVLTERRGARASAFEIGIV